MISSPINKKIEKPWGYYEDIFRCLTMVVKKLVIYPYQRFSLQYHEKRDEHWGIEQGEGRLLLGDFDSIVVKSNSVFIPKRRIHRLENLGGEDLIVYETQLGVCEESDIKRLSDDYGR